MGLSYPTDPAPHGTAHPTAADGDDGEHQQLHVRQLVVYGAAILGLLVLLALLYL